MTVTEILKSSCRNLPRLDAELIICNVLGIDRVQLLTSGGDEPSTEIIKQIQEQIKKREHGYPVAYILGKKDFYKHTFLVEPGVLIPRPETEMLVDEAITFLKNRTGPQRVLDMGCGSGCVGLSIIAELSRALLTAIDISEVAIAMTKKNANQIGVAGRAKIERQLVEQLPTEFRYDCIVANPPYIAPDDLDVDPSVRKFEPPEALFADQNGLDKIREWTAKAYELLEQDGFWATEIGYTQGGIVCKILETVGFKNIKIKKDLSGKDRLVSGVKNNG